MPANFQSSGPVTVPIVFHIITGRDSTGTLEGNVTDTQIELQVDSLNRAFEGTDISFSLLGVSRVENQHWYERLGSRFPSAARYLHVAPLHVTNVYVGRHPGRGGSVNFLPQNSPQSVGTTTDGIFVNWKDFLGGTNPERNEGDVATHEAGHYFGLLHTWGGGGCGSDDGIADTPVHDGPSPSSDATCAVRDTCPALPGNDPIDNFMNYSHNVCQVQFSFDQNTRKEFTYDFYRSELGDLVPTVYDARSTPVTFHNPTFSDEYVYVLPGADVTVTGTVTLLNGAQFIAGGGADLDGITGLDLRDGSVFSVPGYDTPLALSGNVDIRGGSTLRIGHNGTVSESEGYLDAPSLSVAGNVTVTGSGSTLDVGRAAGFSLGASSVAQFDDGGTFTSWGTISLGSYAQLVMESDAGAPYSYSQFVDTTFALGPDARLIFRNGGFDFGGNPTHRLTVRRLNPSEAWDRIALEGDDVTLDYATIEGGTTGALVRARGVVFDNVTFSGNDDGIETDYAMPGPGGIGVPVRSDLALSNVRVEGSAFAGLYLRNSDVSTTASVIEHNAYYGVYVSNATLDPLTLNEVTASGFYASGTPIPGATGDGIWIGADGDVYLAEPPSTSPSAASSYNVVTDNRDDEIETAPGAYLFLGSGSNGDNAVFKSGTIPSGTYLIHNVDRSPVLAENVYWGDAGGPPSGAFFYEPLIDYDPFLKDAPTPPSPPPPPPPCHPRCSEDDLIVEAASDFVSSGGPDARGGEGQREHLRERIRQLRQQIADDPAHPRARRLLRALYRLQRLDRHDVLGERAETMALLAGLRSLLGEGPMPPPLRRAAEHALRAEVADVLRDEDYDAAEALLAEYAPVVEDEATRHGLLLSAASVDEQRGRYAEAVAKIAEVLAALPPGMEEYAAALGREVATIEGRMNEGGAGRTAGKTAATDGTARGASATTPTAFALGAAYPNPLDAAAVVPFEIPEATEVRVAVYDLLGREVAVLTEGRREAGRYRVRFDASDFASGVYVVRAGMTPEASGAARVFSQKLTVLR